MRLRDSLSIWAKTMKTHCRQSAVIKKATAGVMIEQFTGPGISINLVPEGRSRGQERVK